MELYLDSVDFKEIEKAADLGILTGLTTTPTFMHRHGITDVDAAIVKLSHMVPLLHIEAIGDTHVEILKEAERLMKLPLACPPVFKVPISNEGVKACRRLVEMDQMVNIHLIYTLNQAYMAMLAGATYICPLVGRLHDQGHDAMALIEQAVNMAHEYDFDTKVMVSSVRHAEHVRQAILLGAHAVTAPWSVLSKLSENVLTQLGTDQFMEHTRLLTVHVREILNGANPTITLGEPVLDALLKMTEHNSGAVSVVDDKGVLIGFFTDGDIRRTLKEKGKNALDLKMGDLQHGSPITVSADALLIDAVNLFKQKNVDNLAVVEADKPVGILDIQDLVKLGLIG
jgi:transaldolase